ncbi:hypothetical protein Q3G72_011146 [Acer saccharum]|nr:hypothetical protein Q3G72_011146 [Acer saccharum]
MRSSLKPIFIIINNNNHNLHVLTTTIRRRAAAAPFSFSSSSLRFEAKSHFCVSQARFLSSLQSNTVMEVFKAACRQGSSARDSVAIRSDQQSYSYGQLVSSALKISALLSSNETSSHGSLHGARIGIVAKPSAEFVSGVLGTWFSGGVAVPLALSHPESELLHVMNDSDVSMLLSTEDYRETMQNVAAKSSARFSLIPPVTGVSSETSLHDESQIADIGNSNKIDGEDPALVVYTSGTTGKPKGVVHTHKSIAAQTCTSEIYLSNWSLTYDIHVHGLFNALLAPLYAGATVEFMPKFSVRGIWQRWRECYPVDGSKTADAITVFTGVPTMYTRLIQGYEAMDPELKAASASAARQLRLMMCGSSALPLPVMQEWETITGHRLLERYGMTEFVMSIANPLRGVRKAGTVGKPFPGVQVKIVEDESAGDSVGVGELCVKSPSLFKEYWKLPEVTKDSFTDDGFFKTGDTGKVDEDGYYIILGRFYLQASIMLRVDVKLLYAFVVMNCNSFFPMFVMLYVIHYFLSSLLAAHGHGFIPLLLSNLLFMVAGSYYHYLNLLGYDDTFEDLRQTQAKRSPTHLIHV